MKSESLLLIACLFAWSAGAQAVAPAVETIDTETAVQSWAGIADGAGPGSATVEQAVDGVLWAAYNGRLNHVEPVGTVASLKGVPSENAGAPPWLLNLRGEGGESGDSLEVPAEERTYLRYLLPVGITVAAGTATYLLFVTRSR